MKSFASAAAFHAEVTLYADAGNPLGAFLPRLRALLDNTDGRFRDPHGHKMPPSIIMEKGESLDMWCRRVEPDRLLQCAVRCSRATAQQRNSVIGAASAFSHRRRRLGTCIHADGVRV